MTLFDAIALMMRKPSWSVKIYRKPDVTRAIVMDFCGHFMIGRTSSKNKADYNMPFTLARHLIEASNWEEFEDNCTWDE